MHLKKRLVQEALSNTGHTPFTDILIPGDNLVSSYPYMHVIGLWDKTGVPKKNHADRGEHANLTQKGPGDILAVRQC